MGPAVRLQEASELGRLLSVVEAKEGWGGLPATTTPHPPAVSYWQLTALDEGLSLWVRQFALDKDSVKEEVRL